MRLANGEGDATYEIVKDYYGKVLQSSKDLKTSACTAGTYKHRLRLLQFSIRCLHNNYNILHIW